MQNRSNIALAAVKLAGLVAMLAAVAAAGGCNRELDQYQKIELGKPLAEGTILAKEAAADPNASPAVGHVDTFVFPLPSIVAWKGFGALRDANGTVKAKRYTELAAEHWLLAQVLVYRYRLEAQIPDEYFHEMTGGWDSSLPPPEVWANLEVACKTLSAGMDQPRFLPSPDTDNRGYTWTIQMPINPKSVRPETAERLTGQKRFVPIDPRRDLDLPEPVLANLLAAKADLSLYRSGEAFDLRAVVRAPKEAKQGHHVPGYLDSIADEIIVVRGGITSPSDPNTIDPSGAWMVYNNFPLGMYFGGRTEWPDRLKSKGNQFSGVTRDGFDRRIDFGDGGRVRIRNLGDRRVRVEFEFARVIDPFVLIPVIEAGNSDYQEPSIVTTYAPSPAGEGTQTAE